MSAVEIAPMPTVRCRQMGLPVSSSSYSCSRPGMRSRKPRMLSVPPSGRSIESPPTRTYAWFMRRPVIISKIWSSSSRSRQA